MYEQEEQKIKTQESLTQNQLNVSLTNKRPTILQDLKYQRENLIKELSKVQDKIKKLEENTYLAENLESFREYF